MVKKKILIVDDEKSVGEMLKPYLNDEGLDALTAHNCKDACVLIERENPDLIVLDILLPDLSGIDFCAKIRKKSNIPIIFLSCKTETIDKIIALSVGGDDYVTKPFLPEELIARIKALLRRMELDIDEARHKGVYEAPGLKLNIATREVFVNGENVYFTVKEFDILRLLMQNAKRVYTPRQLFEYAWRENSVPGDEKTIMVYISNIRKKLLTGNEDKNYIVNVRGLGYKFNYPIKNSIDSGDSI